MQFLIIEKLSDGTDYVVLGPMNWRPSFFTSCLRDDLEINFSVPMTCPEKAIFISDTVRIIPVSEPIITDNYNSKLQNLIGPRYEFFEDRANMFLDPEDKPIEIVKKELKEIISSNRYRYETKGITSTIQGKEIQLSTSRENRDIFLNSYQSGKDSISWKFGDSFFVLSNEELKILSEEISNHVQSTFNWEHNKQLEIDGKTNLEDLDKVSLVSENELWEPKIQNYINTP